MNVLLHFRPGRLCIVGHHGRMPLSHALNDCHLREENHRSQGREMRGFQKVAPALASMSSRDSLGFGDLIPQDVVEVFAQERMSKSGRRKKRSKSLGRAFGWLKGKKRKDADANGQSLGLGPVLYLALDGSPAGPQAGQKTGKQAGKQGHSPGVSRGKIPAPSPPHRTPP
ncbi:hypothetical protein CRUP_019769 [Coryphaenoides rupestris]|nr:hypothetical protein CRUP_019769 [Coryphaenoides rupestris]